VKSTDGVDASTELTAVFNGADAQVHRTDSPVQLSGGRADFE
jgi:hypothetical protein